MANSIDKTPSRHWLALMAAVSLACLAAQPASIAASDLCAYHRSDNVNSVVLRGFDARIYEFYLLSGASQWQVGELSTQAGALIGAAGPPACYVRSDKVNSVVYRGIDGHIYELWLSSAWGIFDLSALTQAPLAQGDPVAYVRRDQVSSVLYRGFDNHIYELYLPKDASTLLFPWNIGDLSVQAGAPPTAGNPVGYVRWDNVNSVVYRAFDSHIYELSLPSGAAAWSLTDLTAQARAPLAQGDPATYVRVGSFVVYRGFDSHIYQLSLPDGNLFWTASDLSAAVFNGSWPPAAASDPASYVRSDGAASVAYRGIDGHIWELFLPSRDKAWMVSDFSNTALAADAPTTYVRSDNVNSVVYRGADNHIYELFLRSGDAGWGSGDLSRGPAAQ
jgi:hypothetical protein